MRKVIKKTISAITALTIVATSLSYVFATSDISMELDSYLSKGETLYENYNLSDLPEAVSSSVYSTEKTPTEIINQDVDDEYTITVKNTDGTNTVHIFQTPIKYFDNNTIKLKKDTIVVSSEKISLLKNYAYESVDNEIKSYFPENINDGIKMEYGDYSISLSPMLSDIQSSVKNQQSSAVTKIGNTVSYSGIFDSDISLEYAPSLNGIKENIIIDKYNGINTFSFTIDLDGLIPTKTEGDSIPLLDPTTDEMKFYIGQINARDSYTGANENDETHFTLYNSLKLKPTLKENIYTLTVTVDKDFLESETTVYPVTVDPTISISSSNTADAPVYSGYPSTNYYTNEYNMVGYHGSSYKEAMTFVKLNSLSSYKYVNPEKINLAYYRVYEGSGKTSTATINLYDTYSTWNESTITYSNKPGISTEYESTNTISSSGWYQFSITDLFTDWLRYALNEGGFTHDFGFALAASTTGTSSRHFCSANSSTNLPSIVFNYSEDTSIADGAYYIRSKYSNLYLDTEQDASANGNVIQYTFHGNTNQHWTVKHQGNGYYKLYSQWYNEEKCLDIEEEPLQNGSNVDVYDDVNGDYILFKIVSNNDGTYRIVSKWSDNQKVLDVCGPSTAATANIQIWEYMGVDQQRWYFESVNDKNFDLIDNLYTLAQTYDSNNATTLTFQYLRSGKYNSSQWSEVAGDIDTSFSNYVSSNSNLSFLKNTSQYLYDNNQRIDFTHMCAVINAIIYDSDSIKSVFVGEDVIDNLSGWAGDLQTLVIDMIDNTAESSRNNYNTLYNKFMDLMGSYSYHFSTEDLLADLDAIYYMKLFSNLTSGVATNLRSLYGYYSHNRYVSFVDGRTKSDFSADVYFYTQNNYTKLGIEVIKWPLYENSYTITDIQAQAAADAFTDYIWALI